MELWDAYNRNGKKLDGQINREAIIRGAKIPYGVYYMVASVVVKHRDGMYLVMRRAFEKPFYPGLWELGAGAVLMGESPVDWAKRVLYEETGIRSGEMSQTYQYIKGNEIRTIFLCITDIPKNDVLLKPKGTIGYKWLLRDELLKFMKTKEFIPTTGERYYANMHIINESEWCS